MLQEGNDMFALKKEDEDRMKVLLKAQGFKHSKFMPVMYGRDCYNLRLLQEIYKKLSKRGSDATILDVVLEKGDGKNILVITYRTRSGKGSYRLLALNSKGFKVKLTPLCDIKEVIL